MFDALAHCLCHLICVLHFTTMVPWSVCVLCWFW